MKIVRLLPVFGKIIFQFPFFPVLNIVSISGGKDSAATHLLALEQKIPNLMGVFADTGIAMAEEGNTSCSSIYGLCE